MARRAWRIVYKLLLILTILICAQAQSASDITYVYDDAGRLIAVIDPAGDTVTYAYDAVGNLLTISRYSSATASIIKFSPGSGPIGASVIIYGTGFSTTPSQNTVTFNGVAATVVSSTATQIVTSVPAGATTGTIAITTPAGSATSSAEFTVTTSAPGAPTISEFTPSIGTVGASLTISGTNFETDPVNNKVTVNLTQMLIGSSTIDTIVTTIPSGAGSGRISVATPGGKAVSSADFFVPPSPFTAADVGFTDRMAIGGSKTITISASGKIAMVVFDGVIGQQVSLKMSGITINSSDAYIYTPDGVTVLSSNTSVFTSTTIIEPAVLPITGTYAILIDPSSSYTGSMTLTLYDVPPDVSGTITPGGSPVTVDITTPGQNALLTFEGTAQQMISLQMTGGTISGSVNIYNPDGSNLTGFTTQGGSAFVDTKTLPGTGTYKISINPSLADTGSMTLTLYNVVHVTGSITPGGPSVTVTTDTPGQNGVLSFSGSAGQKVSLLVNSTTVTQCVVSIKKSNGTVLGSINLWSGARFIDTVTLSTADTYTVLVDPTSTNVGTVTLTLYNVPPDVSGTITPGGSPVTVSITVSGQNANLTFEGTAGQKISLMLSNATVAGTVWIYNPNGTTLASVIVSGSTGFIDAKTLPVTGTYTISVNPSGSDTGNMTLTLYDVVDVSGTVTISDPPLTVNFTIPGQNASLTFSGTSGQQATVQVTNNTIGSVTVKLLKPDGSTLTSKTSSSSSFNLSTQTLPTTGTYTISIDPSGSNTGSMSVRVTNP